MIGRRDSPKEGGLKDNKADSWTAFLNWLKANREPYLWALCIEAQASWDETGLLLKFKPKHRFHREQLDSHYRVSLTQNLKQFFEREVKWRLEETATTKEAAKTTIADFDGDEIALSYRDYDNVDVADPDYQKQRFRKLVEHVAESLEGEILES